MSDTMIAVTGSTGHLGRLVIDGLLERNVPAGEVVAVARSPERGADLAARGVRVRRGDYTQPDALVATLEGVDKLLLVSSSEVGKHVAHHRNVVDSAAKAGVRLLAYTSILKADSSRTQLASEHRESEEVISESGISFIFLRNSWYLENYTQNLDTILERGAVLGSAGDGRVSAAARADYATAAVTVLTGSGHENRIYELGGDEAFTLGELAEEITRQSGRRVEYRHLSPDAYVDALMGAGVSKAYARVLADSDLGLARGELFTDNGELRRLIGRPTTTLRDAVATALRRHRAASG